MRLKHKEYNKEGQDTNFFVSSLLYLFEINFNNALKSIHHNPLFFHVLSMHRVQ